MIVILTNYGLYVYMIVYAFQGVRGSSVRRNEAGARDAPERPRRLVRNGSILVWWVILVVTLATAPATAPW